MTEESTDNLVKFTPTPGRILIKPTDLSKSLFNVTSQDLVLQTGEVIAVSPSFTTNFGATIECPVKVGDVIQHADTTSLGTAGWQQIKINY